MLLGDLGRRLGLPDSDLGFTTVAQGRDRVAAVLAGKRMLVAVDNVSDRGPLDALTGLGPGCVVLFTTRLPGLAATFGGTQVPVDELTQGQALELLGRWTGQAPAELPDAAVQCAPGWGTCRWASRWPGRWSPGAGRSPTCSP